MTVKETGKEFTKGVVEMLLKYFLYGLAIVGLFAIIMNSLDFMTDDSDYSGWKRSDLKIHTDAKTGIQYLSDGHGGLTIRIDATGKAMVAR